MKRYEIWVPYVAYGQDKYIIEAENDEEAWEKLYARDCVDIQSFDPVDGEMFEDEAILDSVIDLEDE